jgi:hypothetical protein
MSDEDAFKFKKVEDQLNNAVKKSCVVETRGLERAKAEVGVREQRVLII